MFWSAINEIVNRISRADNAYENDVKSMKLNNLHWLFIILDQSISKLQNIELKVQFESETAAISFTNK